METRVGVLGEVVLELGSERILLGTSLPAQLFVALAQRSGRAVERSTLLDLVDAANLDQQLSKLKRQLRDAGADGFVTSDPDTARLDLTCSLDLDEIDGELKTASAAGSEDEGWEIAKAVAQRLSSKPFDGARTESEIVTSCRSHWMDLRFKTFVLLLGLGSRSDSPERRNEAAVAGHAALALHSTQVWSELVDLLIELGRFDEAVAVCEQVMDESTVDAGPVSRRIEDIRRIEREARGDRLAQLPLPPLAHAQHGWELVGRRREMGVLDREWESARSGHFRGVVLTGEPGNGKSRIAYEAATRYHAQGANVLISPVTVEDLPCRPVTSAFRHLFGHGSDEMLDGVDPWMLELLQPLVGYGSQMPADLKQISPRGLQLALHGVLARLGRERPLVLILEDLHKADLATADFVTYLIGEQPPGVLLIGTWAGLRPPQPYEDMRVVVELLDEQAHADLLKQVHGDMDAPSVKAHYQQSGGSPFLTVHMRDANRTESHVRGICERAGKDAFDLLCIAAVYGPTFDPVAVEEVARGQGLAVGESPLEFARDDGLIIDDPSDATRYQFSHSRIREVLRDSVPVGKRARWCAELVPILRRRGEDVALIARRARLAAHLDFMPRAQAADAGLEAAKHATDRGAHAAAVAYLEQALALARATDDFDLTAKLAYELGLARWRDGDVRRARADFEAAALIAQRHGLVQREVEIALAYGGPLGFKGVTSSSPHIALLQHAFEATAGIDDERAQLRLQAALAGAWTFDPENRTHSRELAQYVANAAEREGSPELLAEVLASVCWTLWNLDDAADRRALADRFCEAADQSHRDHFQFESRLYRLAVMLAEGDFKRARREHRECVDIGARNAHHAAMLGIIAGTFALAEGRLDAAEVASDDALEDGKRESNPAILELYAVQLLMLRQLAGRVDTLRAASEGLTDEFPDLPAWKAGLGSIYVDLDRRDDARRCLDGLARDGFTHVPRDLLFLVTLAHTSRIAHYMRDRVRAQQLYELLTPYRDEVVVAGGVGAVYGVVEYSLGLLAETVGDLDGAIGHLERALDRHVELELRPPTVFTALDLARVLDQRGAAGDHDRARELRSHHHGLAKRLGIALEQRRDFTHAGPIGGLLGGAAERVERQARTALRRAWPRLNRGGANADERLWGRGRGALPTVLPGLYRPGAACGFKGRIQVVVRSAGDLDEDDHLLFDIGDEAVVSRELDPDAEVTITLPLKTFFELLIGATNSVGPWLDGLAEVDGDPTLAARLIEMFAGERRPAL